MPTTTFDTTHRSRRSREMASLVHAIRPGLLGASMAGKPATYTVSSELMAGLAGWDAAAPVLPRETTGVPFPSPQAFRRTLVDVMISVPSGPVADVPSFQVGDSAEPHALGEAKIESGLVFDGAQEQLRSIATWIRLSDELVEDVGGLQVWLEAYLAFLVKAGEEVEVLTGPRGYLTRTNIPAYTGAATDLAEILAGMHAQVITDSGGIEPDTYVLNPADWLSLVNTVPSADATASSINGCTVIRTPALTAGQALVGACSACSVLLRNGSVTVEGTQSHDQDFRLNISMIRAASRIGLGVLNATAFVKKTA